MATHKKSDKEAAREKRHAEAAKAHADKMKAKGKT